MIGGVGVGLNTLSVIPGVVLALSLGAAFAMVLSALHVYFRDVRYLVRPPRCSCGLYLTPILYPLSWIEGARATGRSWPTP